MEINGRNGGNQASLAIVHYIYERWRGEKGRQGDMGSDYLVTETAAVLSPPIQSAD